MSKEKPPRTLFDSLALVLKGFSVLVALTMGLMLYVVSSGQQHQSDGAPPFIWQEVLAITTVALMAAAIWWFAGFVARKGREKEAARIPAEAEAEAGEERHS